MNAYPWELSQWRTAECLEHVPVSTEHEEGGIWDGILGHIVGDLETLICQNNASLDDGENPENPVETQALARAGAGYRPTAQEVLGFNATC